MTGIGSIVNAGAIVAGGLIGLAVGSLISRRVQATLVSGMAVGTMFIGALEDGLRGDPSLLYLKSVMDGIFTIALTASLGKGVMFSAIPILLFQGSVTLASSLLRPIMTPEVLDAISLVGGVLIFCVGWNILWNEKKIRVANLLPALVVAVAWTLLKGGAAGA